METAAHRAPGARQARRRDRGLSGADRLHQLSHACGISGPPASASQFAGLVSAEVVWVRFPRCQAAAVSAIFGLDAFLRSAATHVTMTFRALLVYRFALVAHHLAIHVSASHHAA